MRLLRPDLERPPAGTDLLGHDRLDEASADDRQLLAEVLVEGSEPAAVGAPRGNPMVPPRALSGHVANEVDVEGDRPLLAAHLEHGLAVETADVGR